MSATKQQLKNGDRSNEDFSWHPHQPTGHAGGMSPPMISPETGHWAKVARERKPEILDLIRDSYQRLLQRGSAPHVPRTLPATVQMLTAPESSDDYLESNPLEALSTHLCLVQWAADNDRRIMDGLFQISGVSPGKGVRKIHEGRNPGATIRELEKSGLANVALFDSAVDLGLLILRWSRNCGFGGRLDPRRHWVEEAISRHHHPHAGDVPEVDGDPGRESVLIHRIDTSIPVYELDPSRYASELHERMAGRLDSNGRSKQLSTPTKESFSFQIDGREYTAVLHPDSEIDQIHPFSIEEARYAMTVLDAGFPCIDDETFKQRLALCPELEMSSKESSLDRLRDLYRSARTSSRALWESMAGSAGHANVDQLVEGFQRLYLSEPKFNGAEVGRALQRTPSWVTRNLRGPFIMHLNRLLEEAVEVFTEKS